MNAYHRAESEGHSGYSSTTVMPVQPSREPPIPPPYNPLTLTSLRQWPSVVATALHLPDPRLLHSTSSNHDQMSPIPSRCRLSAGRSTPWRVRRALNLEEHQQICLYHSENQTAKQTEIADNPELHRDTNKKFALQTDKMNQHDSEWNKGRVHSIPGRIKQVNLSNQSSTISKILRQKDVYLNAEKGSTAATQIRQMLRTIKNALANWARNQQKCGLSLTDAIIQEKALWFADNCGNARAKKNVTSTKWLNTFKQR